MPEHFWLDPDSLGWINPDLQEFGNPLVFAILWKRCGVEEVRRRLREKEGGFSVDELSEALYWANSPESFNVLLEAGANVNSLHLWGETILHKAAGVDNLELVHILLEAGADIMARDDEGQTPLHRAAHEGSPFAFQALVDAGADLEAVNNEGETPLITSARKTQRLDVPRLLVKAGVNLSATTYQGESVFDAAAGYPILVKFWRKARAGTAMT